MYVYIKRQFKRQNGVHYNFVCFTNVFLRHGARYLIPNRLRLANQDFPEGLPKPEFSSPN